MAKIRNLVLPEDITEELVHLAKSVPEDALKVWARECLPGGFTRPDAIRERLIARLRGEATLEPSLLDFLAIGCPLMDTVKALSIDSLQFLYGPLVALLGRGEVLLAVLLDPREEVQRWGVEMALKPLPATPPDTEDAAGDIIVNFVEETLLFPAGLALTDPGGPEGGTSELLEKLSSGLVKDLGEKNESQRKTIERLNDELQQQKQRHLSKLKEQSDQTEREKKIIRAEMASVRERAEQLAAENQSLQQRLNELSKKHQESIAQQVQEQTSALVRKWLVEPVQIEAELHTTEGKVKDLVGRAEQALELQARQDRHIGNRLELGRRLEQLLQTRDRVAASLGAALHPVTELRPLLSELELEIARLEKLLTGARPSSDIVAKLLASINTAETWEEVRGCSALVDQLDERKLLAAGEARGLYNAVQRKFSLLEETAKAKPTEGDNGWALRDTLYRNKRALLILDGHNLLFGLTDIFSPVYEEGFPRRKARKRLVDIIAKLVATKTNISTKICFDGPNADCVKVAPNLEVHYSGGTGQHRADDLIVSQLQFKDLKSVEEKVFVVTDDREVRRGVLRAGASFVPCDLFAVFLNDFHCLRSS